LSSLANASGHTDNLVYIRQGFAHTDLEADNMSLTLAIAWLNWSLTYETIPTQDELVTNAGKITLQEIPSASAKIAAENLAIASVLLFLIFYIGLRRRTSNEVKISSSSEKAVTNLKPNQNRLLKIMTIIIVMAISFIFGILVANGVSQILSVAWGYLFFFPIVILVFLLIMYYSITKKANIDHEIPLWRDKHQIRNWVLVIIAIICAIVFFSVLYNWCADSIKDSSMSVFNTSILFYISIIPLNFINDALFVNIFHSIPREHLKWQQFSSAHNFLTHVGVNTGVIFLWRLISMFLFLAFVPVVYYSGIPISINLLLLIVIPTLSAGIYFLASIMNLGTLSHLISLILIATILATFLEYRIFRLF
jgi:hypothetical protein